MKIKTGVDIIEISRIADAVERHGAHFLNRIFTEAEQADCGGRVASLAARFSAKEAISKSLGCGIGNVSWLDIEIRVDGSGAPFVVLYRDGLEMANHLKLCSWSLSLSHNESQAVAFVVAVAEE